MTINVVNVRRVLADTINRVLYQGERVVVERRGKGVAALVSMEDLALLEKLEDQADVKAVQAARAEGGRPIPWAQVKAELGLGGATPRHAANGPKKRPARGQR